MGDNGIMRLFALTGEALHKSILSFEKPVITSGEMKCSIILQITNVRLIRL